MKKINPFSFNPTFFKPMVTPINNMWSIMNEGKMVPHAPQNWKGVAEGYHKKGVGGFERFHNRPFLIQGSGGTMTMFHHNGEKNYDATRGILKQHVSARGSTNGFYMVHCFPEQSPNDLAALHPMKYASGREIRGAVSAGGREYAFRPGFQNRHEVLLEGYRVLSGATKGVVSNIERGNSLGLMNQDQIDFLSRKIDFQTGEFKNPRTKAALFNDIKNIDRYNKNLPMVPESQRFQASTNYKELGSIEQTKANMGLSEFGEVDSFSNKSKSSTTLNSNETVKPPIKESRLATSEDFNRIIEQERKARPTMTGWEKLKAVAGEDEVSLTRNYRREQAMGVKPPLWQRMLTMDSMRQTASEPTKISSPSLNSNKSLSVPFSSGGAGGMGGGGGGNWGVPPGSGGKPFVPFNFDSPDKGPGMFQKAFNATSNWLKETKYPLVSAEKTGPRLRGGSFYGNQSAFFNPEPRLKAMNLAETAFSKGNQLLDKAVSKLPEGALGNLGRFAAIFPGMAMTGGEKLSNFLGNRIEQKGYQITASNTALVSNVSSLTKNAGMGMGRAAWNLTKFAGKHPIMLGIGALAAGLGGGLLDTIENTNPHQGEMASTLHSIGGPVGLASMAYLSSRDRTNDLAGADLAQSQMEPNKPDMPMSFGGGGSSMGGGKDYSMGASGNLALALSDLRRGR